jgi:hypothetical protein
MDTKVRQVVKALIIGSAAVLGTVPLTGLLNSILGFIPSVMVYGVSVPHGILSAGVIAFAADMIVEKYVR